MTKVSIQATVTGGFPTPSVTLTLLVDGLSHTPLNFLPSEVDAANRKLTVSWDISAGGTAQVILHLENPLGSVDIPSDVVTITPTGATLTLVNDLTGQRATVSIGAPKDIQQITINVNEPHHWEFSGWAPNTGVVVEMYSNQAGFGSGVTAPLPHPPFIPNLCVATDSHGNARFPPANWNFLTDSPVWANYPQLSKNSYGNIPVGSNPWGQTQTVTPREATWPSSFTHYRAFQTGPTAGSDKYGGCVPSWPTGSSGMNFPTTSLFTGNIETVTSAYTPPSGTPGAPPVGTFRLLFQLPAGLSIDVYDMNSSGLQGNHLGTFINGQTIDLPATAGLAPYQWAYYFWPNPRMPSGSPATSLPGLPYATWSGRVDPLSSLYIIGGEKTIPWQIEITPRPPPQSSGSFIVT